MGNTFRSHDNVLHVRGWTREQIEAAYELLRRKKCLYSVTKEDFARYFGGRNREVIPVFNDLDTDYDGRVDLFEIMVVLTIWSGTTWDDKLNILFDTFDMMNKGWLKIDEIMLLCTVLVQTLGKFIRLDACWDNPSTMSGHAQKAMPPNETKITREDFVRWSQSSDPMEQLRGFIEDHSARAQADSNENRMRQRISTMERHATRLFERIEKLMDRLPDFSDACIDYVRAWDRGKRWDFLTQNMQQLVVKLQQLSEGMHSTLANIEAALNEEEVSGGMSSVIDPRKRFKQEQMLLDLDLMRQQSAADFREATDLLQRLIELTEPSEKQSHVEQAGGEHALNAITEEEFESMIDMSPPRVVESRNQMKQVHAEMLSDTEDGGYFARPTESIGSAMAGGNMSTGQAMMEGHAGPGDDLALAAARELELTVGSEGGGQGGGEVAVTSGEPQLVAIADFAPPSTHQTQMLKLYVGDTVSVLGQDGRGWWYGRKQNGKEGWFPPSYVQVKAAHFSSAKAPN